MNKDKTISNNRVSWKPSSWSSINWKQVEKKVFKLQRRIYKSTIRGDIKTVRKLQKTLMNSWNGKLIAVKRVTTDNRGKKTAGIDGIKSLTPSQRLNLAENLKLSDKAKPVKRVWIPKPGKDEKRPLGIPVMEDRARQCLLKLALEPEWEAKFEPHSYGFRPGRTTHDAIKVIQGKAQKMDELWILDADIKGCFDNINHDALLKKINNSPRVTKQIRAWLKSGVIDWNNKENKGYKPTQYGVPQGGVISPLLSNIALHGLENYLKDWIPTVYRPLEYDKHYGGYRPLRPSHSKKTLNITRYADDFVILHKSKEVIVKAKEKVKEFLSTVGLKLNDDKTQIVDIYEGFDFLGFNVRRYKKVGKYRADKDRKGNRITGRLLIKPSKKSVKEHYKKIAKIIEIYKSASQAELIQKLNPVIRGWSNYYKYVVSKETFSKLDHLIWKRLWRWCTRRHNGAKRKETARRYFPNVDLNNGKLRWTFHTVIDGIYITLNEHAKVGIEKYHLIDGKKSPYDGDTTYWGRRLTKYPFLNTRERKLLVIQKGKCNICNTKFKFGEQWHIDHIKPKAKGGANTVKNLQLVHNYCHINKSIFYQEY